MNCARVIAERLSPAHLRELREASGLSDATIAASGMHTLHDPAEVARILRWRQPAKSLGECLAIPFPDPFTGQFNGFARVKPAHPRPGAGKYEQPQGVGLRAYFTPGARMAIQKPGFTVGVTEGEKKSLASDQAGCACIGLTGVFAWQQRWEDKSSERELIPDLDQIDWQGATVWICFDTDEKRKPQVNLARAELARILTAHGARVVFVDFPLGPIGNDGKREKQGIDDFVVRSGDGGAAFRELVRRAVLPEPEVVSLDEYRRMMASARVKSTGRPGLYQDVGPPGAGKTHADIEACRVAGRSLTILRTHKNCEEVERMYMEHGLDAAAYPELCGDVCPNISEAEKAMAWGLSPSSAVCPECPFAVECPYRGEMERAEASPHRIATHHRARHCMRSIAEGCSYISVHEDPQELLRPTVEVAGGFKEVVAAIRIAADRVWGRANQTARHFLGKVEDAAHLLADVLNQAETTGQIDLPASAGQPPRIDVILFHAIAEAGVSFNGDALRVCRAIAEETLHEISVRVDQVMGRGRKTEVRRTIVAVWQTELPDTAAVWINDATATPEEIEALAGVPVANQTPAGRLEMLHSIRQVSVDITKQTTDSTVVKILRGVVAHHPAARHIGVICHQQHARAIRGTARRAPLLDAAIRSRIAMVEHFRGGQARGSNEWLNTCDLLIVLGTPRVPPEVVRTRLIAAGKIDAAARDGGWGPDYWSAVDRTGRRHTVRSLGYTDHDWHAAHRAVVAAELRQAIGRGRAVCEHGMPVVVVSTEELGCELVTWRACEVTDSMLEVLRAMLPEREGHEGGASPVLPTENYRRSFLNNIRFIRRKRMLT